MRHVVPQANKAQAFLADFSTICPTSSEHVECQKAKSVSGT